MLRTEGHSTDGTGAGHAVHLREEELRTLLVEGSGPSLVEIERWARAQARTVEEAPAFLGGEPPPPAPLHVVPGALARMVQGVFRYVDLM